MKIEIISGSPRKNSVTRRAALLLQKTIKANTNHEVNILDLSQWDLPLLQKVFVSVEQTPDAFKPLSERMFNADAFILVTPEYNGSYSPALKNVLDHYPKQHHKPFGIVTASTGMYGGMRATQQMLLMVPALFGIASPYMLVVPFVDKKISIDGDLLDESFTHNVHNFITEFLWLAESIVKEKTTI
ncbi:MAG: NAD(P)H-dependent oxidoreductase [Bacteroidetes bacterium]|nr:NAD(P)H-dependent oxidoreductase [Bacteroidota bacterium]MBS1608893.1 NAD(P)H-dependent oxidoreductase [Bacteroidota bacterium]